MRGVYIVGQTQRTGTNFLFNLLIKHPDLNRSLQFGEDWLLKNSNYLYFYLSNTSAIWNSNWKGMMPKQRKGELHKNIKEALLKFLSDGDQLIVTKTPSTLGIENFNVFLPELKPIILVRDGRNVVESLVSSFNRKYDDCMREWSESADRIIEFKKRYPETLLVKYENLNAHTKSEMITIFNYLGLETENLNWDEILKQEIVGSSQTSGIKGKVDWAKRLQKDNSFNPNERYASWSRKNRKRYLKFCSKQAIQFGYETF